MKKRRRRKEKDRQEEWLFVPKSGVGNPGTCKSSGAPCPDSFYDDLTAFSCM
jgi:hypothetical protein